MALSLASLCSRRGKTSALPSECAEASQVSEYDLTNKYGLLAPEVGAVYFPSSLIIDDMSTLVIQAEFSARLSLYIVENCVTHLMEAVADIQVALIGIDPRLRIVMKGGLSMYMGLIAMASAAGYDMRGDLRRLAEDGVFAPSDLDTQILYIGQDDKAENAFVIEGQTLERVRNAVIKSLSDLNIKMRSDKLFEGFISTLAVQRGVNRAIVSKDLVIDLEPGAPSAPPGARAANSPSANVDLVKVTSSSQSESPYFVSTNNSIRKFYLWRNKLMVGYTQNCNIKMELLDVTFVKRSENESKSVLRGVFGACAETDLVARLLYRKLKQNTSSSNSAADLAAAVPINNLLTQCINICNEFNNATRTDFSQASAEILELLDDAIDITNTDPNIQNIALVLGSISNDPDDDAKKLHYKRPCNFDILVKSTDGLDQRVAVCDLEYNASDVLKVVLETLMFAKDTSKLAKRLKRMIFLGLLVSDILKRDSFVKSFFMLFFEDPQTRTEMGLDTLNAPSSADVYRLLVEKDEENSRKTNLSVDNVVKLLRIKIRDAGYLDNPELTRAFVEVFKPMIDRMMPKSDQIANSFDMVEGEYGIRMSPLFNIICAPGRGSSGRFEMAIDKISGGAGTIGGGGGTAAGLWAAALMSVVAAVGAGAGAAVCAVAASGPG